MQIIPSKRIQSLTPYAFAEVDKLVDQLKEKGIQPIDFGVGDPLIPTPEIVRRATQEAVDRRKSAGYPSYVGSLEYRQACASWMKRRFGVDLDPKTEVSATSGAKEAIFNFPEAFIDPGDLVIIPSPGYPPWDRGTRFAEGRTFFVPLLPENNYLIDLDAIPADVTKAAKILWLNYPNNPTGACAPYDYLRKVVEFGRRHDIIIASDEAYTELYYIDEPPHSILEFGRDGVVAFHSHSKRSAMTCYRIGWIAGDERIVAAFRKLKTNIDSGTPTFIQDGAIAALSDETHVAEMRREYHQKRDLLADGLAQLGFPDCRPQGTIHYWQRIPDGLSAVEFAKKLLDPEVGIVATPGAWISDRTSDGLNPGEKFVRFSLVPTVDQTREAAKRIAKLKGKL